MKLFNKIHKLFNAPNKSLNNNLLFEINANMLINFMLNDHSLGVSERKFCNNDIIVSLTSYGRRLQDVSLTIESIMQGTMKPNRIVLWVDRQWQNKRMPISLQRQQQRGLEIEYCKDIRSYTKLVPALRKYP